MLEETLPRATRVSKWLRRLSSSPHATLQFGVRNTEQVRSVRLDHKEVLRPDRPSLGTLVEQGEPRTAEHGAHRHVQRDRGPLRRVRARLLSSHNSPASVSGVIPERPEPAAALPSQIRVPSIHNPGEELGQQIGSHEVDALAFGAAHLGGQRGCDCEELKPI